MTLTADHGRLEQKGERVWVEGNVVITRDADAKNESARLMTDKLLVLPDDGIARTSSEVRMESASSHAVADGLELDNKQRTLKLDRVRATFKPRKRGSARPASRPSPGRSPARPHPP